MSLGLAIGAVLSMVAVASAQTQTPAGERTHPRVSPTEGHRHTAFAVGFTLRHDAGVRGVIQTGYRLAVVAPRGARRACAAPAPAPITSGRAGTRRRVRLRSPRVGWCRGRYAVTVYVETGPYCPKPGPGGHPQPCPMFASRLEPTGTARFRVVC